MTVRVNNPQFSALAVNCGIKAIFALLVLFFSSPSLNAQFSVTTMAVPNYKRPFGTIKNKAFLTRETSFTIKEIQKPALVNVASTWRYHITPALLIISVDSKNKMEINLLMIKSNYKVQHLKR